MPEPRAIRSPVRFIEVRLRIGDSLLAASEDPLFLGVTGPGGREFRLLLAHGKSLRRKAEDRYVLGPSGNGDTNVEHPELNDPTLPALDADDVTGAYLRKGLDPIPNVRAVGELDDRLELVEVEVTIHCEGTALRYFRAGPIWLGLVTGMQIELARIEG